MVEFLPRTVPENDFMHQNDTSGCPTYIYRRLVPGGERADGHCGPTWTPPWSGASILTFCLFVHHYYFISHKSTKNLTSYELLKKRRPR
jgi:hypothetical protein